MPKSKSTRRKTKRPARKPANSVAVKTVRRRFEYVSKKDDERLISLLAETGTRWEATLFPLTWETADAKDKEFIRQYVAYFRPFHPCAGKPEAEHDAILAAIAQPHMEHIRKFIDWFCGTYPDHWK